MIEVPEHRFSESHFPLFRAMLQRSLMGATVCRAPAFVNRQTRMAR